MNADASAYASAPTANALLSTPVVGTGRAHRQQRLPQLLSYLLRAISIALVGVVGRWVAGPLGGVRSSPLQQPLNSNSTDGLFNWHPVLMVLAFAVLMAEAMLTWRTPLFPGWTHSHSARKAVHSTLLSAAVILIALGLVAVFQSHNLKRPEPIRNLYSPHSFLGLFTVVLLGLQFLAGAFGFLVPGLSAGFRQALVPLHRTLGTAVFVLGLSTIAAGLQEKASIVQSQRRLSGASSAAILLPAVAELMVAALLLCMLAILLLEREQGVSASGVDVRTAQQQAMTHVGGSGSRQEEELELPSVSKV